MAVSFRRMAPANYPDLFACLGMVIGLYGVLYIEIARRPEYGWLIAAVGLSGKILGPSALGFSSCAVRGRRIRSDVPHERSDLVGAIRDLLRDSWRYFHETLPGAGVKAGMVLAGVLWGQWLPFRFRAASHGRFCSGQRLVNL